MKRTPKQYARALYDAIQEKGTTPIETILDHFVRILAQDGVIHQSGKILESFRQYWNQQKKEIDVRVDVAQKIPQRLVTHIGEAIQKSAGAQAHTAIVREDATLLGGAVIRYEDVRIDGSVRRQLTRVKEYFHS